METGAIEQAIRLRLPSPISPSRDHSAINGIGLSDEERVTKRPSTPQHGDGGGDGEGAVIGGKRLKTTTSPRTASALLLGLITSENIRPSDSTDTGPSESRDSTNPDTPSTTGGIWSSTGPGGTGYQPRGTHSSASTALRTVAAKLEKSSLSPDSTSDPDVYRLNSEARPPVSGHAHTSLIQMGLAPEPPSSPPFGSPISLEFINRSATDALQLLKSFSSPPRVAPGEDTAPPRPPQGEDTAPPRLGLEDGSPAPLGYNGVVVKEEVSVEQPQSGDRKPYNLRKRRESSIIARLSEYSDEYSEDYLTPRPRSDRRVTLPVPETLKYDFVPTDVPIATVPVPKVIIKQEPLDEHDTDSSNEQPPSQGSRRARAWGIGPTQSSNIDECISAVIRKALLASDTVSMGVTRTTHHTPPEYHITPPEYHITPPEYHITPPEYHIASTVPPTTHPDPPTTHPDPPNISPGPLSTSTGPPTPGSRPDDGSETTGCLEPFRLCLLRDGYREHEIATINPTSGDLLVRLVYQMTEASGAAVNTTTKQLSTALVTGSGGLSAGNNAYESAVAGATHLTITISPPVCGDRPQQQEGSNLPPIHVMQLEPSADSSTAASPSTAQETHPPSTVQRCPPLTRAPVCNNGVPTPPPFTGRVPTPPTPPPRPVLHELPTECQVQLRLLNLLSVPEHDRQQRKSALDSYLHSRGEQI